MENKLPEGWEWNSLENLIELKYGKGLKKENRNSSGEFPVYGSNGIVGYHDDAIVSEPCLIVGRKGSIGAVHLSKNPCWPIDTTYYVLPPKEVDLIFLYYLLSTLNLENLNKSTAIPGLNRNDVYSKLIPLPPLETQQKIVAILEKAEETKKLRAQADELAQKLLQSVFLEMFGDPTRNTRNWETLKFSEVGTLERGKSKHRPRNAPELLGGKYPLVQTGNVANSGGYITEYTHTYSELGLKQSKMWPVGTLCITIAANIAKTGILTFEACFPDSVVGFTPNEKVKTEYIQHWMSFLQKMLEDSAPESAQKNINLKILSDLNAPVPPLELQEKFASIVQLVEKNKKSQIQSSLEINNLFDVLMQKAFTGELVS